MLRKSFENIDYKAQIPEGIEFRKEHIWERIEKRPKKNPKWIWYGSAAALIPLILLSIWILKPSQDIKPNYILTSVKSDYPALNIERPTSLANQDKDETEIQENKSPIPSKQEDVLVTDVPDSSLVLPKNEDSKIIRQTIVLEEILKEPEEKKLSPSAEAIKNALAKTKGDQKVEERLVVEKFTFEQMLEARKHYMQEKRNSTKNRKHD